MSNVVSRFSKNIVKLPQFSTVKSKKNPPHYINRYEQRLRRYRMRYLGTIPIDCYYSLFCSISGGGPQFQSGGQTMYAHHLSKAKQSPTSFLTFRCPYLYWYHQPTTQRCNLPVSFPVDLLHTMAVVNAPERKLSKRTSVHLSTYLQGLRKRGASSDFGRVEGASYLIEGVP